MMKILNYEKCALVLKLNPLELGIITFLQIPTPWWSYYKSTSLLVMNLKLFVKIFTKLKTPSSLHGLQFSALDIIVGCTVRFINYLLITPLKVFNETEDISIFAWFSILGVGHYRWLYSPIRWPLLNNKADYLVRSIWCILDFLQLWTITVA
jgi:hypothetical protein